MKKLLLALLFTVPAMAQDGVRNEGGKLIWERTYPISANVASILETQPGLKVTTFMNDVHTGVADKIKNTCDGGSTVMRNHCKFDFEVRKADDSYVVTVTNIKIIEVMGPMQARTVVSRCEKYLVDSNHKLKKDARSQGDISCLDSFLTDIFGGGSLAGGALTAN